MRLKGLKKLEREGRQVSLWPRPRVLPGNRVAAMLWRVQTKGHVVELHAPSGHFFDATDVINHYRRHGDLLILDAQVEIHGHTVDLIPQPWGATTQALNAEGGQQPRSRDVNPPIYISADRPAGYGAASPILAAQLQRLWGLGDNAVPTFTIMLDLRRRLYADVERAERNGDPRAETLRQMATYAGTEVRDHARDIGLHACAKDYPAARELMKLVVAEEQAAEARSH